MKSQNAENNVMKEFAKLTIQRNDNNNNNNNNNNDHVTTTKKNPKVFWNDNK